MEETRADREFHEIVRFICFVEIGVNKTLCLCSRITINHVNKRTLVSYEFQLFQPVSLVLSRPSDCENITEGLSMPRHQFSILMCNIDSSGAEDIVIHLRESFCMVVNLRPIWQTGSGFSLRRERHVGRVETLDIIQILFKLEIWRQLTGLPESSESFLSKEQQMTWTWLGKCLQR